MPHQLRGDTDMTSQALYFIEARSLDGETVFVERDPNEACWSSTIHDLLTMQIDHPVRVLEVIPDEHWSADATAKACQALADHAAAKCETLHPVLIEWIESNLGTRVANELQAA